MDIFNVIKTLHIISSTVLFGTGMGIAFFMAHSFFTNDIKEKLYAARSTVLADYVFTLPAVIIQPFSGAFLIVYGGHEWTDFWIIMTIILYGSAGLCWLPVVWLQIQLKKMLQQAVLEQADLPDRYHTYFKYWFFLGWPAFGGLIVIFFLMVMKPL